MRNDDLREDLILTESQFREVIERATRADLRDDGISVDILRQVAEELDIDPRALQRALGDVIGAPDRSQPARSWIRRQLTNVGRRFDHVLPKRGRLGAGIVLGTFFGWLSAHVAIGLRVLVGGASVSVGSSAFIDVPVFVFLALLIVANSLSRRLDGRFGRYLAEVAAMWGAFAIGWSVTFGGITADLALLTLLSIAGAAVWGWLVIRRKKGFREPPLPRMVSDTHTVPAASDRALVDPTERTSPARLISLIGLGFSLPQARRILVA